MPYQQPQHSAAAPNGAPAPASLSINLCDLTSTPLADGGDVMHLFQTTGRQLANASLGLDVQTDNVRGDVGSYLCDQLFLALAERLCDDLAAICRASNLAATLVVPIFAQSTLACGTERIEGLISRFPSLFDEITVNDYGMAARLADLCRSRSIAMNWGRLFMKDQRDPRHLETSYGSRPCAMDAEAAARIRESFPLGIVELDPFAPLIDTYPLDDVPYALHLPHCFMSTGHLCEAASARRTPEHSFRANAPCARECRRSFTLTISDEQATGRSAYLLKSGRTVFFENESCRPACGPSPARVIWSPQTFACPQPEPAADDPWTQYTEPPYPSAFSDEGGRTWE